jgi:alkylation response protein AidB-like acyl-CoA dehydrogenase
MSSNFFKDNDDLQFQLSLVPWDEIVPLIEAPFGDEDGFTDPKEAEAFYSDLLSALGEFAANEVAPHRKELDEQHPHFEDGRATDPPRMRAIMDGLAQMGAMGLGLPRRLGGMNAPLVVTHAFSEVLGRADVSVMSHYGFHGGIANALLLYSLEEGSFERDEDGTISSTRFDEQARAMASGKEWGAMVLTEPGAGSDLARIRAKGVEQEDGSWRVDGSKIWITSGHGHHHVVLARTEDPEKHPGLKGLSLFYVPVEHEGQRNFEVGGIEEKMGQHSATAATINYDNSYAELIGKRGHGFRGMLLLMNNARIAVGFEGVGLCETAYRLAAQYADERVTMGKPISQHEMIADYLDDMDVTIRGLRAMSFEAAVNEELAARLRAMLKVDPPSDPDEKRELEKKVATYKRKARHLTPLIKYMAGEEAVRLTRMAMQIHGGMGYMVETGIEKLHRDALILPVYEGTSQIQALMALKDNLQAIIRNPSRFFATVASARMAALRGDPLDKQLARLKSVGHSAMQSILTRIAADKLGDLGGMKMTEWKSAVMTDWDPKKDFSFGLLHAERFTKILSDVAVARILVKQAHAAKGTEHEEERREIAERWLDRAEPRAKGVLGEIEATSGSLIARLFSRKAPKEVEAEKSAAE